jgi:hypothetical protein
VQRALGQFGAEQNVAGRLRRQLERFEQLVASVARPRLLVDSSKRAERTGFERRVVRRHPRHCDQFRAGIVEAVVAGQQQAQRDMRLQKFGVIPNGCAIAALGRRALIQRILCQA